MNIDEIDEMEAGRGINVLIAYKIMGWTDISTALGEAWGIPPKEGHSMMYDVVMGFGKKAPIPGYSTNIDNAWDIITRMNDASFLLERSLIDNDSWRARFGCHEDGRLIGTMTRGTASTPALAICRAVLKLWEGSSEDYQPTD